MTKVRMANVITMMTPARTTAMMVTTGELTRGALSSSVVAMIGAMDVMKGGAAVGVAAVSVDVASMDVAVGVVIRSVVAVSTMDSAVEFVVAVVGVVSADVGMVTISVGFPESIQIKDS